MRLSAVLVVLGTLVVPSKTMDIPTHCMLNRPVAAQEGNPGHKRPAPGDNCTQDPKDTKNPDHSCHCHRECKDVQNTDENGEATDGLHNELIEDPKCTKFCFKNNCMCPVHNCD